MTFKGSATAIKSVLALSIFLLFPGCTDFLQGKPKKQDFIEIKKDNLACVKDISNKFKIFIQSGATDQEVDRTFECIDFTLLELQNRAEGRADKNSFSNEDVFKIFNQFLHEAQISQDATNDLLKLKAGLIGGQEDQITKPEMSSLRELLKKVQVEVHQLIPFVKIYGLQKGQRDFTKQTIEDAFKQLALSANKIFKATQLTRSGYQFEDFKKLMTSLSVFQGEPNGFVGLAVDVKNLLVGQESLQSESDFGIFITGITDLLKLYAYQNQGYANFTIIDANSMNETLDYVQEWVRILENSVQYKKTKILTQESLDPFIYKIADQGLLPISIKEIGRAHV